MAQSADAGSGVEGAKAALLYLVELVPTALRDSRDRLDEPRSIEEIDDSIESESRRHRAADALEAVMGHHQEEGLAFVLHEVLGLSLSQSAEVLGKSAPSTAWRLARKGRELVRRFLRRRPSDEEP